MKTHFYKLVFVLGLSTSFVLAQSTAPQNPPANETKPEASSQSSTSPQSGANADVQSAIEKALQQEPALANVKITVSVTDSKVELSGTVSSDKEKQTAESIAKSNAGDRKVVNKIKVSGQSSQDSQSTTPR